MNDTGRPRRVTDEELESCSDEELRNLLSSIVFDDPPVVDPGADERIRAVLAHRMAERAEEKAGNDPDSDSGGSRLRG